MFNDLNKTWDNFNKDNELQIAFGVHGLLKKNIASKAFNGALKI